MNIEKQTGIPYEILIRFAHPDSVDKAGKLGDLAGAHYIEAEALIDADSGEVVQYKQSPAQDLPRDKVADILGARFVDFEAQVRGMQVQLADAAKAAAAADETARQQLADRDGAIAAHLATIAARDDTVAALTVALDGANDRLRELAAQISGLGQQIAAAQTHAAAVTAALA